MKSLKQISDSISACDLCKNYKLPGLCIKQKETGLKYGYPKTEVKILLIAESPPVNGFFYDTETENRLSKEVFKLLTLSGFGTINTLSDFDSAGFYLADSINCRWNKRESRNLPVSVYKNCFIHLKRQIDYFNPLAVITLGTRASESLLKLTKYNFKILKLQFPFGVGKYMTETREERIDKLKDFKQQLNL